MLIRVVYKSNVHDYVKDFQLDRFLDAGEIVKFQRRAGWVTVGIDPLRTNKQTAFGGIERRTWRAKA
jgi:hypothetical protein